MQMMQLQLHLSLLRAIDWSWSRVCISIKGECSKGQ